MTSKGVLIMAPPNPLYFHWRKSPIIKTTLFVYVAYFCGAIAAEHCDIAQNRCQQRLGCSMALYNYVIGCAEVIQDDVTVCPLECKNALMSLLSTQDGEGENIMACDCDGNAQCARQKSQLDVCTNTVLESMNSVSDETSQLSCSLAQLICEADTSCLTALQYYQKNCARMLRGERCTFRCNNSLAILYRQTKAQKLRTCVCDGSESFDCMKVRRNTQNLCFGGFPHATHRHSSRRRHRNRERTTPSSLHLSTSATEASTASISKCAPVKLFIFYVIPLIAFGALWVL